MDVRIGDMFSVNNEWYYVREKIEHSMVAVNIREQKDLHLSQDFIRNIEQYTICPEDVSNNFFLSPV